MNEVTTSVYEALQKLGAFAAEHEDHEDVTISPSNAEMAMAEQYGIFMECRQCKERDMALVDNMAYRKALGHELSDNGFVIF